MGEYTYSDLQSPAMKSLSPKLPAWHKKDRKVFFFDYGGAARGNFRYNSGMSSNAFFDEEKWLSAVTARHDWYKVIYPEFEAILAQNEDGNIEKRNAARSAVYGFFERLLNEGKVILGETGKDWDRVRTHVDTIVIHHTKGESGMTWQRLDAMHLLRLYAKAYLSPSTEKEIQGQPVYSHHFRDDRMVFYAYHWLVRRDGTLERLLYDSEIGWQAGNWEVNCRSVAICLDGDFEHTPPPIAMINGVRALLREYYDYIEPNRIIPHHKANPHTTCPGDWFEGAAW